MLITFMLCDIHMNLRLSLNVFLVSYSSTLCNPRAWLVFTSDINLVFTSDIHISTTTYASAVSTSWPIELFLLPQVVLVLNKS